MKRYCLALDLKNEPEVIEAYDRYHRQVWPEILQSIHDAGINSMEIYRWQNRLTMILEVNEGFSFEAKARADAANPIVQEWETLMSQYQQALPGALPGQKWQLMEKVFQTGNPGSNRVLPT